MTVAQRSRVSVGEGSITVDRVEREALPGRTRLRVFTRVDLPSQAIARPNAEIMAAVLRAPLVDSIGRRYAPVGMVSEQALQTHGTTYQDFERAMAETKNMNQALASGDMPAEWKTWAVEYLVPADAGPLRLLVENPDLREGQARRVAVRLR